MKLHKSSILFGLFLALLILAVSCNGYETAYYYAFPDDVLEINDKGEVSMRRFNDDGLYGGDIVIPEEINGQIVTGIEREGFVFCQGITNLTIPETVKSIGGWAFYKCSGLKSITIPASVTWFETTTKPAYVPDDYDYKVSGSPFRGYEGALIFASGTKKIPWSIGYSDISEITIPATVSSIDSLSQCSSLKTVNYDGTFSELNAVCTEGISNTFPKGCRISCTDGSYSI